ncbi:hypothetical protein DL766_005297 [Monosporascus sp. MC13-8B]|uniref:Uncharacterized protein n=1 Tax=Monosporascus cannonballus TaxID=155416 RepID=A0ABY0GRN1_9PEZI|nr:hypothetical protein DL762_010035 [Monosporascus cannonballus]RYO76780.1 hypothetical protein DL763_010167 [Monosporascus cannonballus]RYP29564.1 hypothetical protein DL766_005297 [Monosporascus sp. MC13-8B]
MRLAFLLLLEALVLVASAARSDLRSIASQTGEDGTNAALRRLSPTSTARSAATEVLHRRDCMMDPDTCGFGSVQHKLARYFPTPVVESSGTGGKED